MAEGYRSSFSSMDGRGDLSPEGYSGMMGNELSPILGPLLDVAGSVGQTVQDMILKAVQVDGITQIQDMIEPFLLSEGALAAKMKAAGPTGSEAAAREYLVRVYKGLFDNWKAGMWRGVGTGYMGAMAQFLQAGQVLYAYKTQQMNIAVVSRMARHWMRTYTPSVPNTRMAWELWRHGILTNTQYKDYASFEGWDASSADYLNEVFSIYPSVLQAFDWWRRGWIDADERDAYYFGRGWDTDYHERITDDLYHVMSSYELVRLADYVEIDQTWAIKQLRRARIRDEDIAKLWQLIELRPLREEVRNITNKWLWRYRVGRCPIEDLETALIATGIKTKEFQLLKQKAELDYEDELIDEKVEILMWQFRTAMITREEYQDSLEDLGIKHEKANLMVELQLAMGYIGYY